MVRHLQHLHLWNTPRDEGRIDLLLDVAGEQEPLASDVAEEDDRRVVDPGAAIRRLLGHGARVRPQDTEADVVDGEPVAGREDPTRSALPDKGALEGGVSGTRSDHSGLEQTLHPVLVEHGDQTGHVILVRMGQDDDVDAPIPRWQALVERHDEAPGVRTAIDQEAAAARSLQEDRIALPDVEDRQARDAVGPVGGRDRQGRDGRDETSGEDSLGPVPRCPDASVGGARDARSLRCRRSRSGEVVPPQPAVCDEDQRSGARGDGHVPGRGKLQARKRDRGPGPDEAHDRCQQRPGGEAAERGDDHRCPGDGEDAGGQRDRSAGHRRRHKRDHGEIHDRRDDRQPPELERHDRERRELGCERDPQGLRQPGPEPTG